VIELQQRVKVSRGEVWKIILLSLPACPLPFAWRKLYPSAAKAVASGAKLA
jgi:hypothetical protein